MVARTGNGDISKREKSYTYSSDGGQFWKLGGAQPGPSRDHAWFLLSD
jgi:hypothetical protein